jgi:hypothetical protein
VCDWDKKFTATGLSSLTMFSCDCCGVPLETADKLRRHKCEHHSELEPVDICGVTTPIIRNQNGQLDCPFSSCIYSKSSRSAFLKHLLTNHDVKPNRKKRTASIDDQPTGSKKKIKVANNGGSHYL